MNTRRLVLTLVALTLMAGTAVSQLGRLQETGQVVAHARRPVFVSSTTFIDIPGLKGAITLPKGGDLSVTASIEGRVVSSSTAALYVRLLVDGQPAGGAPIKVFAGNAGFRSTTATFLARGVGAGPHRVQLQGYVTRNTSASLGGRSLTLRFAAAGSPDLRFFEKLGTSETRKSGGMADLSGMNTIVNLPWKAGLNVTVSGEFWAYKPGKRIFLQALVDGKPAAPGSVVIGSGDAQGNRSFTFVTSVLSKGSHQIRIQWAADDYATALWPKITAVAINHEKFARASALACVPKSGPAISTTSASYTTVPGCAGSLFVPTRSDVTIRFGAETYQRGKAECMLRATLGGKPAEPHGITFSTAESTLQLQSREVVFVFRNVERGRHTIIVQWAKNPFTSGTVYLGDRTMVATAIQSQYPLLVTALESDRPSNYRYGGKFSSAVVETRNGQRVFRPGVRDNLFRAARSVADWFHEVSQGNLALVEAGLIGPRLKSMREDLYRQQSSAFTKMKHEALRNADAVFDYSLYDRNDDGKVTRDELFALVILYQDSTFGEVSSIPAINTNDGVTLDYGAGIATVYTPDFRTNIELGAISHELAHLLIGAGNMSENDPTSPGPYSLMDNYGYFGHLDPVHKLRAGKWFSEVPVHRDGWVTIRPSSKQGAIYKLFDPRSHSGEYFLVENRQRSGYDANLPAEGVAVWHVDDQKLPNYRTAVEMVPAEGPNGKRGTYLYPGTGVPFSPVNDVYDSSPTRDTRWRDGKKSGIGVWAVQRLPNGDVRCFLDVPGPGLLVQPEAPDVNLSPAGYADLRIRVVNTGPTTDRFRATPSFNGELAWTTYDFELKSNEQIVLWIRAKPNGVGQRHKLTMNIRSLSSSAVADTQSVTLHRKLRVIGTPAIGKTVTLLLQNDTQASRKFTMGASFGVWPGIPMPGLGTMPLNADALFYAYSQAPSIFKGFWGKLDATGSGASWISIPKMPQLRGIALYCAYYTYDSAPRDISNAVRIQIQ